MIFDDHDVRDDWNTSYAWKQEIEKTDWWHERIVSGLGVLLGLPAPRQPVARRSGTRTRSGSGSSRHDAEDELDLTGELDDLAERVDQDPETYRWSYARDFGDVRLVVVDSRAARVLEPDRRDAARPGRRRRGSTSSCAAT